MRTLRRGRPLPLNPRAPRFPGAETARSLAAPAPLPLVAPRFLPLPAAEPWDRRAAVLEARAAVASIANEGTHFPAAVRACLAELTARLGFPVARALLFSADGRPADAPVWHAVHPARFEAFRAALAGSAENEVEIRGAAPAWRALRPDAAPAAWAAGLRGKVAVPVPAAGGWAGVVELWSAQAAPPAADVLDACAWTARQLCTLAERLRERQAVLAAADTLRAALDAAPSAPLAFDADGRLSLWTAAAERALGFTAAEAAEKVEDAAGGDAWAVLRAAAAQAVRTTRPATATLQWCRGGVELVEMALACTPLLAADGTAAGAVCHLTEGAGDRTREEALAMVSHDLRSPLHVISIASGALLRAWPADPELAPERRQIEVIAQSASRMNRLAADLVDASRMDAGAFAVCPEPVAVDALLRAAVEAHRPLAKEKGIELTIAASPDATVMADEHRVQQVFSNLIGNALAHTPRGGAVTLRAEPAGHEARLSVADTGCGIAAEDLPKVFERFWRGARCRKGGAGLGLSIARAIVEAHGGLIRAESRPAQGSTFTFTLPLSA